MSRAIATDRRVIAGVGTMSRAGSRITGKPRPASNAASPGCRAVCTTTDSGGIRLTIASTNDSMPPTRGGKSLVTTRVRPVTEPPPGRAPRCGPARCAAARWGGWRTCRTPAATGRGRRGCGSRARCCMVIAASGACVRSSACTSARVSIRREIRFCPGPVTKPMTATRASTRATARPSPSDGTPARPSSHDHRVSRASTHTSSATPTAPIRVPHSTSLLFAWPSSCATISSISRSDAESSSVS